MQQKTLTSIVFAGALALNGCHVESVNDSRYDFKGTLGNEQVEFKKHQYIFSPDSLSLLVIREDGRSVIYFDWNNDLRVDEVKIEEDFYINDVVGQQAIELAQQQFDSYLSKILEYKQQKAVNSIK